MHTAEVALVAKDEHQNIGAGINRRTRSQQLRITFKSYAYNNLMVDLLMEKLHFPILIEIDEDGLYIVSCPIFKGCHSWGETIDEAMENIREVIEICLEETKIDNLNTFVGFRDLEVVRDAKASCD